MSAIQVPDAPVVLSTASVYPEKTPAAFEIAAELGYDGVEVMVTGEPASQDVDMLRRLSDYHQVPILAVHSPCLIVTQRVWGRDPWVKLVRSKEMAETLGARTVVVHPAFRWQREYAKEFETGLARMQEETDIVFAVENMYPVHMRGKEVVPYAPSWNPLDRDYPDVTLDLSHTAMSRSDAMDMAAQLGDRLSHVHLADGLGGQNIDEHLIPGRGNQPCAELLEHLAGTGYDGQIVLEVSTRKAPDRETRRTELAEALAFARLHFARAGGGTGERPDRRERIALRRATAQTAPRRFSAGPDGTIVDET
ncbi:sugar phosphate isomerase/epimerase family protein [Marinactinospora thermotolerans]|uniref:Sugar phosphate isomerase/epimerase n=1 Tax=Marinactinospora thermotolerans DSM 45154 TaxID=1122192 RepID=A0A1T4SST1_9ACTN|nr:sugar phosphate isomerase/epimerase [Marinactinospora thermotolerans]SKA31216.1 Sugar phosphate isomerase/epimerase [Marinactinospora thermotolerans DSM 45154]